MEMETMLLLLPLTMLIGGFALVALGMNRRGKALEMAHRERLAMIERGLVPSPEVDPEGFEAATRGTADPRSGPAPSRSLSVGIVTIGLGLGLMLVIGVAAESPSVGIGLGGAVAVLGLAFVTNHLVTVRRP